MPLNASAVQIARDSRAATVALTEDRALALAKAWVRAWDTLAPEFKTALDVLADSADDTGVISASTISKDQRIAQALTHAHEQLEELHRDMAGQVAADLPPIITAAAEAHHDTLLAQLPEGEAGTLGLGRLDDDALDSLVARTTERIHALSIPLTAEAVDTMRRELIRGMTVGDNPRVVAARMLKKTEGRFGGGLARAERIARTELLDAHRATDQASARKNRHLIAAQVWHATLDRRTCPSCLGMHGTEFPPTAFGPEDHPQGRCVFVPRTKTWAELGFTGIEDEPVDLSAERDAWWNNLTKQSQDNILGQRRADLLRNGQAIWTDFAMKKTNPDWRAYYIAVPLKKLPTTSN